MLQNLKELSLGNEINFAYVQYIHIFLFCYIFSNINITCISPHQNLKSILKKKSNIIVKSNIDFALLTKQFNPSVYIYLTLISD